MRSDACTGQPPLTFWQPAESSRSRAAAHERLAGRVDQVHLLAEGHLYVVALIAEPVDHGGLDLALGHRARRAPVEQLHGVRHRLERAAGRADLHILCNVGQHIRERLRAGGRAGLAGLRRGSGRRRGDGGGLDGRGRSRGGLVRLRAAGGQRQHEHQRERERREAPGIAG